MGQLERVDVFGLGAVCAWLGISFVFAVAGDGAMFSRMGALGTTVAILYFAYVRHAEPYPVGLRENLKMVTDQGNYLANCIQALFRSRTVMAYELRPLYQNSDLQIPPLINELSKESMVRHSVESPTFPIKEWEENNTLSTKAGVEADNQVGRVKFLAGLFQAWIVAIATLQWGFGDIPFSYFKCGAVSC